MKSKIILALIQSLLLVFSGVLYGCSDGPDPINYGSDICTHCNMKIMDNRFGAVLVNSKTKSYKFDAAECLIEYIKEKNPDVKSLYVTDFNNPGNLILANNSFFIISPKRKSPMGENLSAYSTKSEAESAKSSIGGDLLDWNALYSQIGK